MTTRVVFDTNVLVSFACWPESLPYRVVERACDGTM
jgi:predicted nucleic acid-binding protein